MSKKPHDYYKRWYEAYAKMFVENIYNKSWRNCFSMKEKPDLQSETLNIGIEVTSSLASNMYSIQHAFNEYIDKEKSEETLEKIVKKAGSNAIFQTKPLAVGLHWDHDIQDINGLINIIEDKTSNKLPHYRHYEKNMLYIFTQNSFFSTSDIKRVWKELKDIFFDRSLKYDFYFIDCIEKVFTLNADDGSIVKYNVSQDEMNKLNEEAMRIAMEYNSFDVKYK